MNALRDSKIGIIGASGAVGCTAASQLIKDGYSCVVTYRSREITDPYIREHAACIKLDIDNEEALKAFCRSCSTILNCAGPSYIIGNKVAYAALKAGCNYIDAFGVVIFDDEKIMELSKERPCVLGAGTVPGLSGTAAFKLSCEFDQCDAIKFYSYALENSTKASMIDVLLSSMGGYGQSDKFYKNGHIQAESTSENEKVTALGIETPMKAKLFLYNELVHVAKKYGINNIRSYNLISDPILQNKMSEEMSAYIIAPSLDTLWKSADKMCKMMEAYLFGKKPEYVISLQAEGIQNGEEKQLELCMKMHNSLKVTGICAALATENTIKTNFSGLHWGYEMLEFDEVSKTICANGLCSVILRDTNEPDEEGEI